MRQIARRGVLVQRGASATWTCWKMRCNAVQVHGRFIYSMTVSTLHRLVEGFDRHEKIGIVLEKNNEIQLEKQPAEPRNCQSNVSCMSFALLWSHLVSRLTMKSSIQYSTYVSNSEQSEQRTCSMVLRLDESAQLPAVHSLFLRAGSIPLSNISAKSTSRALQTNTTRLVIDASPLLRPCHILTLWNCYNPIHSSI